MDKLLNFLNEKMLPFLVTVLLIFIPLYPKLPLVGVQHTWVYIRLEDFLIASAFGIWALLFIKKRISLPKTISFSVILYWLAGFVSTIVALVFIFPHLANVFPNVAIFHYLRRIEYVGLLFLAFSTIKKPSDLNKYLVGFSLAVLGVVLYGLGQKFLGFPAFLTMNEEFAKGIPLYLPPGARITSTFAGHYDLAAFLVLAIAILGSLVFGVRHLLAKAVLLFLSLASLTVLLLTASRVSFAVYLLTIIFMLVLQKQKKFIIPVIIISFLMLVQVRGTAERFAKTFRVQQIVYNTQTGQPIGILEKLPPEISGLRPTPTPYEPLPLGTGFIAIPQGRGESEQATSTALVRKPVSTSLKLASASSEISTISGSFLIQKAFVYDISFTTRFQGEWPRAWQAFLKNPILGTGFSSLGLATDNDYLRLLGETGILGFASFLFIFLTFFILLSKKLKAIDNPLHKSFVLGLTAGIFGLFLNAILIDVFEASKVAFVLWLLVGLAIAVMELYQSERFNLWQETKRILTSRPAIYVYLFLLTILLYQRIFNFYFVGDDFVWLKWAAQAKLPDLIKYFYSADGFFYRPLPKILYFLAYAVFWLKPIGYHLLSLLIYYLIGILVFVLAHKFFKSTLWAFLLAVLFLFLPVNTESVIWVSCYSGLLMTVFVLSSLVSFLKYREGKKIWIMPTVAFFLLGLLSHEAAVVLPILLLWTDFVTGEFNKKKYSKVFHLLLFVILALYGLVRFLASAHWLSGDYSYKVVNLPFNLIGNFLGYLAVIFAGLSTIPYYDFLRLTLRENKSAALGLIVLIVFVTVIFRKFVKKVINRNSLLFLGLIVISLLPFLGLGNIAERYGLLASVFAVLLGGEILTRISLPKIVPVLFLIFLLFFYQGQINKAFDNWEKAGQTTRKIIYAVKDNYRYFIKNTTVFFVNVPIRIERSWVFPVGLPEAMWFIYRDLTMKVVQVNSVEEAMRLAKNIESKVFVWDKEELKEVNYK